MNDTLVARIRQSMLSSKFETGLVTLSMRHDFENMVASESDIDLAKEWMPVLIESTNPEKQFPGQLSPLTGIF